MSLVLENFLLEKDKAFAPPSDLESIFSEENLTLLFQNYVRLKQTRGLDKITPRLFAQDLDSNIRRISQQCLDGSYKFTRYIERLVLKKRDTLPRILCIPTIKDKLVLKGLNQLLKSLFKDSVFVEVPNKKIRLIKDTIKTGNYDVFLKFDVKNFYDCIDHPILFRKLKQNYTPRIAINLLQQALSNVAVPVNYSKKEVIPQNVCGVHQGRVYPPQICLLKYI